MPASELSVSDLWAFATGGSDVAARPSAPTPQLHGPRPAGVAEAAEWMRAALADHGTQQRMLFLVGGPGGGKSHVTAHVVRGLYRRDSQDDGLAHRTYDYEVPGTAGLLLLNDATIPRGEAGALSTLAQDIESLGGRHLVACVNRGVLVDELAREANAPLGTAITSWLRGDLPGAAGSWTVRDEGPSTDYLRQGTVEGPGLSAQLLVVFVDACSLLEARPAVTVLRDRLEPHPYDIARFGSRRDRNGTPAGQFLSLVVDALPRSDGSQADPIAANLHSLQSDTVRNGVLTILRAAELASGQRLSYRQLWGAASRLVAGNLPEEINAASLEGWLGGLAPSGWDTPTKRFDALRVLASVRLHMAIFGHEGAGEIRHPLVGITSAVDPSRDLRPRGKGSSWSQPLFEAFSASTAGASPLTGLVEACQDSGLREFVTPFDRLLDDAFVEAVANEPRVDWCTDATAWYGLYLTRMLGVATGNAAFMAELDTWTEAWQLSGLVPTGLKNRLLALISPRREPDELSSPSLVPLYSSRAIAMVGRPTQPTLAVRMPSLELESRRDGEELILHVFQEGKALGQMVLDLALVREALAIGRGWLGLTDMTESTVPRLERFRAVNLMHAARKADSIQLVTQHEDHDVRAPKEVR